MLVCSLTNIPTQQPVLSLISNHVFDAKALESHVNNNGTDPINNESMSLQDIVPINNVQSSIPSSDEVANPTYSSIPTMLSAFQNAWDSLSLELFHLRSELDKTKKELSLSLYRQDAAMKVAVGACKERDDARRALAQLVANEDVHNVNVALETVPHDDLLDEVIEKLRAEQVKLLDVHKKENKDRKGKSPLYELDFESIKLSVDKKSGITRKSPSVLKIEMNETTEEGILIHETGMVELIDFSAAKLKSISKINTKNPHVFWMQSEPYVVTTEKSKPILTNIRSKENKHINTDITDITDAVAHPTLPLFIIGSSNGFEVFFNEYSVYEQQLNGELETIKFHPDGLLIGLSYKNSSGIDIYDLAERTTKLNVECESHGDFAFAANGYYMFISTLEKILLFDMRKNLITLESPIANADKNQLLVDDYTTLVVCNNNYIVLDKKGRTVQFSSKLEMENNGKLIGLLGSESAFVIVNEIGIFKSHFTN